MLAKLVSYVKGTVSAGGAMVRKAQLKIPSVLLRYPFEIFISLGLLAWHVAGLTGFGVSANIIWEEAGWLASVALSLTGAVGAAFMCVGVIGGNKNNFRSAERTGLWLSSSVLLIYLVVILLTGHFHADWAVGTLDLFVAVACAFRARSIRRTDEIVLASLEEANANPEILRRIAEVQKAAQG